MGQDFHAIVFANAQAASDQPDGTGASAGRYARLV